MTPQVKTQRIELASVLLGLLVGVIVFGMLASAQASFAPEDAGLGLNTEPWHAEYFGVRVSGRPDGQNGEAEIAELLESFRQLRAQGRRIALWLGASQLHGLNNRRPGDRIAVFYANQRAEARKASRVYLQASTPNGSLHDLLGLYLVFRQSGLIPDDLIVALTYDDLRERRPHAVVLKHLQPIENADAAAFGGGLAHLRDVQGTNDGGELQEETVKVPVERNATSGTPQEKLEAVLVRALERIWEPYRERGKLSAAIRLAFLSEFARVRGGLMRRRAPPVPTSTRTWNLEALDSLIRLTRQDGVSLLVYKAPHRPGEAVFYHDRTAYDGFFEELQERLDREGVAYEDFELIVPADYWGLTRGRRPDVFHFQAEGHQRLGRAVDSFFESRDG